MSEAGMTTAEYSVGTLGAASLAAILIYFGVDSWYADLLWGLVRSGLDPGLFLDHLSR
jgi:hypothetical protein